MLLWITFFVVDTYPMGVYNQDTHRGYMKGDLMNGRTQGLLLSDQDPFGRRV